MKIPVERGSDTVTAKDLILFWMQVYAAAIANNCSSGVAELTADEAMEIARKRFAS